jgi:hypothetical protein
MATKETLSLYDTILKSPDRNAEVKLHRRDRVCTIARAGADRTDGENVLTCLRWIGG